MRKNLAKKFLTTLALVASVLLLAPLATPHAAPRTKPNIVFILADDLGFAEIGANGADHYQTPNIDSLAKTGIRFNHFYTAPLCGPSRALILLGRYAFRSGAVTQDACASIIRAGEKAEVMIPPVLKKAGYTTAMIGKWGQLLPSGDAAEWGFDHMLSFKASGVYWNKAAAASWVKTYGLDGDKFGEGGVRANPGPYNIDAKKLMLADHEYIPDLMHQDAMAFINENKDRPFFLYYSMSHVHSQILPTPDSTPPSPGLDAAARYAQVYNDNIAYMDKLVGKLLAELDRLKLRDNTVVFFMGDNGTAKAASDLATIGGRRLIGQKGGMEEGGGLVPFIINWRGVTPAGRLSENFTDASDLLPTFAEIAGAPLPENRIIDGKSLLPQIKGETKSPRTWAFTQLGENFHMREAGWKLNQAGQLFDMKNAPFEEIPVPADSKDGAAMAARQRLSAALVELNPGAGFKGEGSGRGDKSKKVKKKAATESAPTTPAAKAASVPSPLSPADAALAERAAKFDHLDQERLGQLTRAKYISRQSDPEAASKRFDKFDVNEDGIVTRDEYIHNGAKKLKTP
ncbi:MAG: sulfatase-like hydrolase/transferase [Verrucomicrobia bacterium]|nr:sulfatase-like hydrolase/transferase [Verrucomicrobiota bacterium]